jgi:PKD repeat protein
MSHSYKRFWYLPGLCGLVWLLLLLVVYHPVRAQCLPPAQCQPATRAYCCDFGLARVQLAGIDHRPGGGAASYQDASCANQASLRADWPDSLRLTTGGVSAHDVRVYLDFNNDGQYDPKQELLYQAMGVISPTIPLRISSLTAGLVYNSALRLRICADYAGSPAVGPCAAPEWGQVVDYAVLVLPNSLKPRAAFHLTYTQTCGAVKVNFTNTSVGSAAYRWDFGDGTISTAETPTIHTYTNAGAFAIKLVALGPVQADSTQQETAVATVCPSYCVTNAWGGNEDSPLYFTRVSLADMDNQEFRGPRVGYRDFTGYVATVRQGQLVQLRAESQPFSSGGAGPWVQSLCWIDYNQDGQFGPSELTGRYTGYSPQGGSFRIPSRARLGATRMRLVNYLVGGSAYPSSGCTPNGALAAIEDYTVLILPEHTAPQSGFLADLAVSCSGQVQFRDTTWSAPTNWRWDFGDGTTSTETNPLHTYGAAGTYTVSLQTRNAYGTSSLTRPSYVTIAAIGQGPRPTGTSLPNSYLSDSCGIARARLATLTYEGGKNQLGYRDETCAQPALLLTAGKSYPLVVTRTDRGIYNTTYLWLDANDDGRFDANERIFGAGSTTTEVVRGDFLVPLTALRDRPLRLRLFWHGSPNSDAIVPDPQTRDEEYDQIRDFTVRVSTGALATSTTSQQAGWSLYPIPTSGLVTLTGLSQEQEVFVRNALGQLVLRQIVTPDLQRSSRLNIKGLSAGVYSIQLSHYPALKRLVVE